MGTDFFHKQTQISLFPSPLLPLSLHLGRLAPSHFVSSSVIVQNSLTIPQRKHGQQSQPLLEKSPSPSSSLVASSATQSSSSSPWDVTQRKRSTSSEALSERSLDSRISSRHLYPDDAAFGKGGLLGLADCMSSKQKTKS